MSSEPASAVRMPAQSTSPGDIGTKKQPVAEKEPGSAWSDLVTMECSEPRVTVQAKLQISAPNDPLEREADAVADRVMRMPAGEFPSAVVGSSLSMDVQRTCNECEQEIQRNSGRAETENATDISESGAAKIQSARGVGKPLPEQSRLFFESRIGADFSNVRVRDDAQAADLARSINARAFTLGQDITFAAGEYAPNSFSGKKLLAHELTHVAQQTGQGNIGYDKNIGFRAPRSNAKNDDVIQLSRDPDVVHNGHYSFYLLAGGGREIAVQFHYPGTGNDVNVKMASMRRTAMVEDTYTLSDPGSFAPVIVYEDGVTTSFDLDGDGQGDLEVHVSINALYTVEFLTSDSNPGDPEYARHEVSDTFAVMRWDGVEQILRMRSGENAQAWVTRPHPHPHINFVYYNQVTREYFIPSEFSIPSTFRGVRTGQTPLSSLDITVLDWGESWNGFNVTGGALTWDQIDASSVEGMIQDIQARVATGSCIGTLTIIGHGSPGSISVGDGTDRIDGRYISGGALDSTSGIYDADLARLLARLTPMFCSGGSAVLRGCNVGDGALGRSFTQNLANLWQVRVKSHVGTVRGGGYWTTGSWTEANPTPAP